MIDNAGKSILSRAVCWGNYDIVKKLLNHNVKILDIDIKEGIEFNKKELLNYWKKKSKCRGVEIWEIWEMVKNTSRNIFFTTFNTVTHKKHKFVLKKYIYIYIYRLFKCIIYIYTRIYDSYILQNYYKNKKQTSSQFRENNILS